MMNLQVTTEEAILGKFTNTIGMIKNLQGQLQQVTDVTGKSVNSVLESIEKSLLKDISELSEAIDI